MTRVLPQKHIKMDAGESALWKEVGARGEAFRRAMQDRAEELLRTTGAPAKILDREGHLVLRADEAIQPAEPGALGERVDEAALADERPGVGLHPKL